MGALLEMAAAQPGDGVQIRSAPYHPPSSVIAVDTTLVELAATVHGARGAIVGGLTAPDFQVLDDGKPQKITSFEEQRADTPSAPPQAASGDSHSASPTPSAARPPAPRPRSILLFFDDTQSSMAAFERARLAAQKLISAGLPPGDRIGIYSSSGAVGLDFTADGKALLSTVAKMIRHPAAGVRGYGGCPTLTAYQAYVITNHLDAMAKAVAVADIRRCAPAIPQEEAEMQAQETAETVWGILRGQSSDLLSTLRLAIRRLAAQPGARVLLMSSPGFVTGGLEQQTSALTDECLRDRITMNVLDNEGLLAGGPEAPEALGEHAGLRSSWADRTLGLRAQIITGFFAEATAATGGTFFHNNNDLLTGMRVLESAPLISYLIGFAPDREPDGKYHKLKVRVSKPGSYEVTARSGYFAVRERDRQETAQGRIDRAVSSGESISEFPAALNVNATPQRNGTCRIKVNIRIDARHLPFGSENGASLQQLTFVTVLQDAAGNFVEGKEAIMDMVVTSAKRRELEAGGIKAVTYFVAPAGSYRVREVIREAVHNRLTATNAAVEAH